MIHIACLYTCHNRKKKTIESLKSLYATSRKDIEIEVFLTDDGCTDGTVDEVRMEFPEENINIIHGDGNLFWAKGMIEAWKKALFDTTQWDFYLLLNDDTFLFLNAFEELLKTHEYALSYFGCGGIYSGITCDPKDHTKMTYGGDLWVEGKYSKTTRLKPSGTPQLCNMTNANIFMVERSVVDRIGIFYPYQHGCADNDYTIHARKAGIPVLITGCFCGECEKDHKTDMEVRNHLSQLTFFQRVKYFQSPLHSIKDKIIFTRRNMPLRLPYVIVGRMIDVFVPTFYTWIKR